jgi:hypothetical protein
MRPNHREEKSLFVRRFMAENPQLEESERALTAEQVWAWGPGPESPFFAEAVQQCCKMGNIPEVEAIVRLLEPAVQNLWDRMLNEAAEGAADAQQDDLGPEWILALVNELWLGLGRAYTSDVRNLFRDAAIRLGAGARATTAASDLAQMLRGKFQLKAEAVANLLARKLPVGQLRQALGDLFGPPGAWRRAAIDIWAYRWTWVAAALRGALAGRRTFRYVNPLDRDTTPFCRWLVTSGRVVTLERVLRQVNEIERAVTENNFLIATRAWPMIDLSEARSDTDFNRLFVQNNLGAPPFHFFCRTALAPI